MALCTLTLNFWGLNYILPTVGMVLSLLGFRALRRENGCFTACFVLTLLRCVRFFPTIVLNAFPCRDDFIPERVTTSLAQVFFAAQLLGLLCLWLGLRAVQRKAGLPPKAGGVLALLVWYAVMYVLVLMQYPGLYLPLLLAVIFIVILFRICKTAKALGEAGHPADNGSGGHWRGARLHRRGGLPRRRGDHARPHPGAGTLSWLTHSQHRDSRYCRRLRGRAGTARAGGRGV